MLINMDEKIELWKKNLLDLGKRNRLINFRPTKKSTLTIKSPAMKNIWDSFVEDENKIVFPLDLEALPDTELKDVTEKTKSPLVTDKVLYKDFIATLANLRSKAKSVSEEQGINTLYLTFGLIQWTETNFSNQTLLSPLLLVPVKIIHESIASPYELILLHDEIVVNPALIHKFSKDLGIELPSFDENIEFDDFIKEINEIASERHLKIIDSVNLGLFSFLKINMYNDLERNRNIISEHSIVRAICGDKDSLEPIPESINQIYENLDKEVSPENTFQVLDADSSQQKAILYANNGVSFILQGPPGTGKSQTITNIIAESLANNKKVLFVSEKIAALDVVHKRLAAANLDDFCLVLHNHKANKKNVLEQLNSSLELSGQKTRLLEKATQELMKLYDEKLSLDEYAKELHTVIKPLDITIYEVNGRLSKLDYYKDLVFDLQNVKSTDEKKLNRCINLLERFSKTYNEQLIDPINNPWKNTTLETVTNVTRRNINAIMPILVEQIDSLERNINDFKNKTTLKKEFTLNEISSLYPLIEHLVTKDVAFYRWFKEDDICSLIKEVSKAETECNNIKSKNEIIEKLFESIPVIDKPSFIVELDNSSDIQEIVTSRKHVIESGISNDPYLLTISNQHGTAIFEKELEDFKEKKAIVRELENKVLKNFEEDILKEDVNPILKRIKTEYSSIFRIFKKNYKTDLKFIKQYSRELNLKLDYTLFVNTVSQLSQIKKTNIDILKSCQNILYGFGKELNEADPNYNFIKDKFDSYNILSKILVELDAINEPISNLKAMENDIKNHFCELYNGLDTSWGYIKDCLRWSENAKALCSSLDINDSFIKCMCENKEVPILAKNFLHDIQLFNNTTRENFEYYFSLFTPGEVVKLQSTTLNNLKNRIDSSFKDFSFLENFIDFNKVCDDCNEEGLHDYIDKVINMHLEKDEIIPCFLKRFYSLWLDEIYLDYPAVRDFRRLIQDSKIKDFVHLDKQQLEIAKARIRTNLINSLPVVDSMSTSLDEIGILKREIKKQRRRMPIRKLFQQIPNLIMSFKPCLMMSPLSVSLFLESNFFKFDVVIFDEASQVKTENSIGAIFRGKQLIIAGDSKQLPPTNFFNVTTSDEDFDSDSEDEELTEDYESVIDEANLLPEETLKWHYRSKDEQLIAFSNAKIYKNQLITFPSNKSESVKDNGVEYYYLKNGVYDRGGSKGNIVEAEKVTDLVFEHIKKHPSKSLGVITFGEKQQRVIETAILERRLKNPQYEDFFNEDILEEPFFIKNLENVQGDERDTIILSIGYAKDSNGVFRMNFGPLNKMGGERRLNVAITRAKSNLKLVGSILPTDINLEKINSEGPKLLRGYIDFAMNGIKTLNNSILETDIVEFDSPFEESVYNYLDRKGYKVVTQVGCSGYRIDMAVKHPSLSGIYVIGIECDGATYHSSKTARDRDRLRQEILENMGWTIYRVWSTDWVKDSKSEGEHLISAIEDAILNYSNKTTTDIKIIEEENKASNFIEVKKTTSENKDNIYGFDFEDITNQELLPNSIFFDTSVHRFLWEELVIYSKKYIPSLIDIIEKCSPIHIDELCNQVLRKSYIERNSETIRQGIKRALEESMRNKEVIFKDDFFVSVRAKSYYTHYNNHRKIDHIAMQEISNAMYTIISKKVGLNEDALFIELAKSYNFQRLTKKVKDEHFVPAFNLLLKSKKIQLIGDKIKLLKENSYF